MFQKRGRVKREGKDYKAFTRLIFNRDGWECRCCGKRHNLQVHHLIKRSKVRLDTTENCLTLCVRCHDRVESGILKHIGDDANKKVIFRIKERK